MRLPLVRLGFALSILLSFGILQAQVATGTYTYGSYDSPGVDTINVGNLNAHITIPVVNKPGRGLPFYYNLSYDSSVWSPMLLNGSHAWTLALGAGWRGAQRSAPGT